MAVIGRTTADRSAARRRRNRLLVAGPLGALIGTMLAVIPTTTVQATDTLSGENAASQGVTAGHAFGYNSGTVGIAMLGTYSAVVPPPATVTALKNLLVAKADAHGLDTALQALYTNPVNGTQATFENVPGHREVPDNATECPGGVFLDTVLRSMRSEMQPLTRTPDRAPPAAPLAVAGGVSKGRATLTWPLSAGDAGSGGGTSGVAGYDVLRAPRGGVATRLASTTGLTYTDSTRAQGVAYDYYVQTYDGAGNRSATVKTLSPI